MSRIWKATSLENPDYTWKSALEAYWEIWRDPIGDDFAPDETPAAELLHRWAAEAQTQFLNGLVPIYWVVRGDGIDGYIPFQYEHDPEPESRETFLDLFTWPVDVASGERLNWLELPVVDKIWISKSASKGGFIQQATRWKPSILQPFVYLPALLSVLSLSSPIDE
jgi:hypothetical protein